MMDKKAQQVWISWVLIIGLVVVIGVFVGRVYLDTASSTSETVKDFLENTEVCSSVGISVVDSCQIPQALNIEVANLKTVRIDDLVFRIYNGNGDSESIRVKADIEPGSTLNLSVGKSGMAAQIDIIPLVEEEDSVIMCSSSLVELESIRDC